MVRADKSREGEGLARRVEGDGAALCVLGHGLRRDVSVSGHDDVRPNFVRDNDAVVILIDLHGLFYLPALPHAAAGVVGGAEDSEVYAVLLELSVHVLIVHAPDAVFVAHKLGVNGAAAGIVKRVGKADICRRVDEHLVAGRGERLERGAYAAENAVFVADVLRQQPLNAVSLALPADYRVKIFAREREIPEVRHFHALVYRVHDRRRRGKAHVRYPHGNGVKALVHCDAGKGNFIRRRGILPAAVEHGSKIVFHISSKNPSASCCGSDGGACAGPWPQSGGCARA